MLEASKIKVTEELLAKRAGSRGNISEKILKQCRKTIEIGEKLLEPQTLYDVFTIVTINENRVYLGNRLYFESEHLAKLLSGADRIVVMCCTIGSALEERVSELQKKGDLVESYFLDIYGAVAVSFLVRNLYNKISNQLDGYGTTVYMEPGQLDWDVRAQEVVWQLIHPNEIGVTLNDSMMMNPVKSITGVFGIGDRAKIRKGDFSCLSCPKRENCAFRHEAEEMMHG